MLAAAIGVLVGAQVGRFIRPQMLRIVAGAGLHHPLVRLAVRGKEHRGELRFVTDFGEKDRHENSRECFPHARSL